MYSARLIHLFFLALGFVVIAQASSPNGYNGELVARQDDDTTVSSGNAPAASTAPAPSASGGGGDDDDDASSAAPAPTTNDDANTPLPSPVPSTTPRTSTPPTANVPPSSSQGAPGNSPTSSQPPATDPASPSSSTPANNDDGNTENSSQSEGNNNQDQSTPTASDETPSSTPEPITSTIRTVIITTDSAGQQSSITSESVVVSSPTLRADSDKSDGGMSTQTKNTIIGVVCGVGGAIILGALGYVGWRMYNRKKKAEENDGLMDYNTAGTSAFDNEPKNDAATLNSGTGTGTNRSPFQTTLENYHQPSNVNASSNF